MANTSYLTKTVEPFIVRWVGDTLGVPLSERAIVVGRRKDGAEVRFAFDGVSQDASVGLLVSTSLTLKPGGQRKLYMDASILKRAPFQRRVMAFVDREVCRAFVNRCDGLLDMDGIELLVCDELPDEMKRGIESVQAEAKREVGDKGRVWKVPSPRRVET